MANIIEQGINITSNKFLENGKCKYADSYGNTVIVIRKGEATFTAKLRFMDKDYKVEPITISVPDKENGQYLHVDYPSGKSLDRDDVSSGISMLTIIIQHWIDMINDIKLSRIDSAYLASQNDISIEEVGYNKVMLLKEYEELDEFIDSFLMQ